MVEFIPVTWNESERKFEQDVSRFQADSYGRWLPGVVLKMKDTVTQLVGDVNGDLGVCDDCHIYTNADVIGVYRFELFY